MNYIADYHAHHHYIGVPSDPISPPIALTEDLGSGSLVKLVLVRAWRYKYAIIFQERTPRHFDDKNLRVFPLSTELLSFEKLH